MYHRTDQGPRPDRRGHAFSLVEGVVVLLLLGILLAVAVSRAGHDGVRLPAETASLKSHLRHAQVRALADTAPWGLLLISDRYTLLRNGVAYGQLPGLDSHLHLLEGVTISSGTGVINFNSWGEPCDAAGTVHTADVTITLSDGDSSSTLVITKNTGFVY